MRYKINIDEEALNDIQEATDWYIKQLDVLGTRYQKQVKTQINSLKSNPYIHSTRYANVHCMLIKKFPFLVHYVVDKDSLLVKVFAIIHTSRNPEIWKERSKT